MHEFSWTSLFCVTAICFILFSSALHILDSPRSALFLKIGFTIGGIAVLMILNTLSARIASRKRDFSRQNEDLH